MEPAPAWLFVMPVFFMSWIKLHRGIFDTEGYFSEPFCKNMAFIDLILLANHKDDHFYCHGMRVDVKRGEVGCGLLSLSKRWKWSIGKVVRFLGILEKDGKTENRKVGTITLVSILNYDKFQKKDAERKTNGKQTETNKKYQEINTDIQNTSISVFISDEMKFLPGFEPIWREWVDYKFSQFREKYKNSKSESIALRNLEKLSGGNHEVARQIVAQSITSMYRGLFPLKNKTNVNKIEQLRNITTESIRQAIDKVGE
jgi:hypothetical protein